MNTHKALHQLVQGSESWHQFRLDHFGASEAAPMLGLSKKVTRSELLRMKHTGVAKEFSNFVQTKILDYGHEVEALARPLVEDMIADELYPATYSLGKLSASVDGLTMDGETAFEHKQWNADLAAAVSRGELPEEHQPQCQQIMLVTGASRVIFVVSDGTRENFVHMEVKPDAKWFERIQAGWAQFEEDLKNYQVVETASAAVAAPTMQLPALSIQVNGSITLIDNLKVFGERLESFIAGIDKNPSDDQAFADAEAAIKTLGTAETALEAAKSSALAQTASIDEMTRTVALYANQARTTRLMLEKLVKAKKESIRVDIVQGGRDALAAHIAGLHKRLGKVYPIVPAADFASVIKGKRTITSLHDAVDTELARAKIEANAIADRIQINLSTLQDLAKDCVYLFADAGNMVTKDADDFTALVKARIADHKAAEAKRLEAEREKIRAEEAAKLQKIEQERLEAARIQQEGIERAARAKETAAAQPVGAEKLSEGIGIPESRPGKPVPTPAPHAATNSSAIAGIQPTYAQILKVIADHFDVTEGTADAWIVEYIRPQQRAA